MTDSLTEFAIALYGAPGVETECLAWQDSHQLSVPLLLCAAWLDARGTGGDESQWVSLCQPVLDWEQQLVWPVRSLRRHLKPLAEASPAAAQVRDQVKQAELSAELAVLAKLSSLPWRASECSALTSFAHFYHLPADCEPFPALRRALAKLAPSGLTGPDN